MALLTPTPRAQPAVLYAHRSTLADVDTSRISPTAHYTGTVWWRHGLSVDALTTVHGRVLFHAVQPFMLAASRTMGGVTLEQMLLDRHLTIDDRLHRAITSGSVGQVLEIAAGLSARGHRFARRYSAADLIYVEGDLPGMAGRKRRLLESAGLTSAHHHVVELNALAETGPHSLAGATERLLEPDRGTAVITEGLINYFDRPTALGMWQRFATFLSTFPAGVYLTDMHLGGPLSRHRVVRIFVRLLGIFARGGVHLHFADEQQVVAACRARGFTDAHLLAAGEGLKNHPLARRRAHDYVHVLEARTEPVGQRTATRSAT